MEAKHQCNEDRTEMFLSYKSWQLVNLFSIVVIARIGECCNGIKMSQVDPRG